MRKDTKTAPTGASRLARLSLLAVALYLLCYAVLVLPNGCLVQEQTMMTSMGLNGKLLSAPSKMVVKNNIAIFHVDEFFRNLHNNIDSIPPEGRCASFGVTPHNEPQPRRIFFGSMLADENMEVLKMHAIEAYDIYHVAAFVESNTTHSATPRKMHFYNTDEADMLKHSQFFGRNTTVEIGYWWEDMPDLIGMDREVEQRNVITSLWRQAGMTDRDLGLMTDVDEIISRDFLRALQVCDFPSLRYKSNPSCRTPITKVSNLQFESSPYCLSATQWHHPDIIRGQCIEGIGDPTERVIPLRKHKRKYGEKTDEYGFSNHNHYPKHVKDSQKYPLYTGRDIRGISGYSGGLVHYVNVDKKKAPYQFGAAAVAFHIHNWFDDLEVLRHKYATYGHGYSPSLTMKLASLESAIDQTVRCVRDIGNDVTNVDKPNRKTRPYIVLNQPNGTYNRPLYFLNETYTKERHALIQRLVEEDEAKHGENKYISNVDKIDTRGK